MVQLDTYPRTDPWLAGHADPDSSEALFVALRERMLSFEGFAKSLQSLENQTAQLQGMCNQTSLADLMKKHPNPADIAFQVEEQIRVLEGHQDSITRTRKMTMQAINDIRRLCPRVRASLNRETTRMISDVHKILCSTSHWSGRVISQRDHGLVPPRGQRLDAIVKDLTSVLTFRALPLNQERHCLTCIEALKKKQEQVLVLEDLERFLATTSTQKSSQVLCKASMSIMSLVDELRNPHGHSISDDCSSGATEMGNIAQIMGGETGSSMFDHRSSPSRSEDVQNDAEDDSAQRKSSWTASEFSQEDGSNDQGSQDSSSSTRKRLERSRHAYTRHAHTQLENDVWKPPRLSS